MQMATFGRKTNVTSEVTRTQVLNYLYGKPVYERCIAHPEYGGIGAPTPGCKGCDHFHKTRGHHPRLPHNLKQSLS